MYKQKRYSGSVGDDPYGDFQGDPIS